MDDDLDFLDTPSCPSCLEPMEAVVGAWWCAPCRITAHGGSTLNRAIAGVQETPR